MPVDRLLYIDRLKDAGVEEPIARAHAEALCEALFETVAMKSDLTEAFNSLRTDLKDDIASVRTEMTSMERRIDGLDRKIEITARDLTIRGAGGLVVIASIIIGLKIFG